MKIIHKRIGTLKKSSYKEKVSLSKEQLYILAFTIVMTIFGALEIFNASGYKALTASFQDQFHFLKLHLIWIGVGTFLATVVYLIPHRVYLKMASFAFLAQTVLLILVLIFGVTINSAKRWFNILSIPIQPAEFAKIGTILFFSVLLSKNFKNLKLINRGILGWDKEFTNKIFVFGIALFITLLLIILEPDMGTSIIIGVTSIIMFFLSSSEKQHIKNTFLVGLIFVVIIGLAAIIEPYRFTRVKTQVNLLLTGEVQDTEKSGHQIEQILIGIGSGGFWGKGFGQSRQKYGYLVENTAFTDSTIAIVLEELGTLSGIIMVASWFLFLVNGYKIAVKAKDADSRLLAFGITTWLTGQAFVNIGANVALMPLTGIPLPFLTYGGSSTMATFIAIAILLNVGKTSEKNS